MKTLELKLKKDVLIVEAPLDAYDVSIGTHCIGVRTNENVEKDTNGFYHIYKKGLFFGDIDMKLEFLCKGSELTEEIASDLVDKSIHTDLYAHYVYNIPVNVYCYNSAKESFISAAESEGFHWLENPAKYERTGSEIYADKNKLIRYISKEEIASFKAEEKTFRNPLIFVKK